VQRRCPWGACATKLLRDLRPWLLAALVAVSVGACGEGNAPSSDTTSAEETATAPDELADGTYSCDATNSTRGTGPYSLECEKSGDTIVLQFANGGHVSLDIDSQDTTDGSSWEIEATNSDTGDSWGLTVTDE
jgi:hypothetical protein